MSWFASHRSLVATATSGTVVAALIATLAVVSSGYTAQRMDLTNPSVWVVGGEQQAIGRANTEVLELDSVVPVDADDVRIVQSPSVVLLVDPASATVREVDPATASLGDDIALPPQQPELLLAGARVAVHAQGTGEVWLLARADLSAFDAAAPSTLSLGVGSVVAVTESGALLAYVPEASEVWRVDPGAEVVGTRWPVGWGEDAARTDAVQITAVGEHWAVLDSSTGELATESGVRAIGDTLTGTGARIQQAGPANARVLIASSDALIAAAMDGGAPEVLVDGTAGIPAAPVVVDGCRYAAWSSGAAWRLCGSDSPQQLVLSDMPGNPQLAFAVNGARVALNDARQGASWAVQSGGELIDNWEELIPDDDQQQEQPEADDETPPELEEVQQPPVAVDDEFGARPGRASVLPVLLNDYDPNGDVLVVTAVDPIDERVGRLDLVNRNQQLQVTLAPSASGTLSFGYTISDGRGGTASAVVTVEVRTADQNSAPHPVRTSTATVASGGRVSTQVLSDWIDPDGDAFYLTGASIPGRDQVGFKPDGVVVFTDGGTGTGQKVVALSVTDGRAIGNGSLQVTVRERGEVPILVEPWVVLATAGQEVTVRPLQHVRGGNGAVRLGGVPPKQGTTIVPSFEAGTFTFLSEDVRTHYVEFTVTDGTQTASGFVRIDVSAPADASTRPITVPKTMFITTLSSQTVDPTSTDIDPAGGVLVVTGVMNVPSGSGVRVEVLDQRRVRVSLDDPLDAPVTFNYRISNGLAEAEGTITVVEIPHPQRLQPPIATDDQVTVRVGDAIDIPVLDNDEQPDGDDITLEPELAQELPEDAGLLFAAGDRLRYLAPETAGNYTAVYTIAGTDGQLAQARVVISVRERNAATNNPPVPRTVTARVLAGQTVRIDIPTSGVDPDGDAVQLVGQVTNPEKGSVLSTEGNTIEYQAGDYSSGTDIFQYAVVDGLGARATGTVRVGISPPLEGARNPVANLDTVLVRPGRTVSVQALLNDSDPDGSPLTIRQVEPGAGVEAEVVGDDVVRITPPEASGDYAVIYTIENETGGTSQSYIRVTVSADAPLSRPTARDSVLSVSDVLERTTVDVAVLERVFFADGEVSELGVSLVPGYGDSAEVLPNKRVRVTVGDRSQIIPFAVVHPDNAQLRAYAFIWVPGYDDALPQVNTKAPLLVVKSESSLRIELSQYVVALGGAQVRLTDTSTVRATHANGEPLAVDEDTLVYTSADRYWGPASITFEVTDGQSATDPDGHVTTLSLPIRVDPRDNQPPVFTGGVVDFEPGQDKELDLVKLTKYPYDDDIDELTYSILEPLPAGFQYRINGQRLLLTADPSAVKGAATSITLGVRDALSEGQSGRIQLRVVPSTRPLARLIADRAVTRRGESTVIDVLANDAATNPFPEVPLKVTAIRGIGGASLPAGVTVVPSADRSRLTVSVSDGAEPLDTNLQYQVADATGDPDRMVWGSVTISVQDVPDPVTNLRVTEFGDRVLKLGWSAGLFNNSPITEYRVTVTDASGGGTLSTVSCTLIVGCAITTPGNGPTHAVRLSVVAINAIGDSDPTALTGTIWSDVIPPPPAGVASTPLDHGLRVTWRKPVTSAGSAIDSYVVTVGGIVRTLAKPTTDPDGTAYEVIIQDASIANGTAVEYRVSARNKAPNSLATWNEDGGSAIPAGAPIASASPTASASTTDGTTASVAWSGAFDRNGRRISSYYVAMHTGTPPECTVTGLESGTPVFTPPSGANVQELPGGTTTATFGGLSPNTSYTFTVYAYNGQGCTASSPVTAIPRSAPGDVGSISTASPVARDGGYWDYRLLGVTIPSGSADVDSFVYRLSGGTTDSSQSAAVPFGSFLTAGTSHYGNLISVEVKACRQYPEVQLCSPNWSPPVSLGRPVSIQLSGLDTTVTEPPVLVVSPGRGYWSWTGGPSVAADDGQGYGSVSYDCGADDDPATDGVCEVVGSGLTGDRYPDLVVTVTANGTSYARTFSWADPAH